MGDVVIRQALAPVVVTLPSGSAYAIKLTAAPEVVTLTSVGVAGPPGQPGPAGGATAEVRAEIAAETDGKIAAAVALVPRSFSHVQLLPSAEWTVNHGVGRYPVSVHITDTDGDVCIGTVVNPSLATTVITFSAAFAGTAQLLF